MRITKENVVIYGAGKTWSAAILIEMRDQHGFNINSRWIDFDEVLKNPDDTFPDSMHKDKAFLQSIWDHGCKEDCRACDVGIMVCTPADGEKLSGALVELGHVTGEDKPWYILGTCASVEPVGHSDRAWKAQKVVHHWPEMTNPLDGFNRVLTHYRRNYRDQWFNRNIYRPLHS